MTTATERSWLVAICECKGRVWLHTLLGKKCIDCGATVREAKVREVPG